jgi:adenylate cyclase
MRYLKRHWRRVGLSLVTVLLAFFHQLGVFPIAALDRIDAMVYDARLQATMPKTFDDRIVIVDVDEKSLAELGRWPWSRQKMASLTESLFGKYQIVLLGFDVVFAEPDDSSGLKQLQALAQNELRQDAGFVTQLAQLASALDYDRLFAKSLLNRPVVMGYYFSSDQGGRTSGELPQPVMAGHGNDSGFVSLTPWNGFGANIGPLAHAAPLAGFFNSLTDPDGVVRALPLVARYADNDYESLSLAMFRRLLGMPQVTPGWAPEGADSAEPPVLQSIVLKWPDKTFSIPVDERGAMWVPFRGYGGVKGRSFQYLSASDVLAQRVPEQRLKGKIVLVGTTAIGIVDLRATPVAAVYPGVEVHANALSSLLDRRFLVKPTHAEAYEVVLLLLAGLTLAFVLPLLRAPVTVALSLGVVSFLVALNWWLYQAHALVLHLAPILLMTVIIFVLNIGYGYLVTSRSRRALIALFGTYVPPELVQEMIKDPDRYTMRAKSDKLTVMFCDMRGFTRMSEQMDPVQLQHLLNDVLSELTQLIGANRGTVDKYMGDCVMAFWGAPVESPAHAQLAVKTALQMTQALGRINRTHKKGALAHVDFDIGLGIGINTGQMYVWDMGSNIRRSYTVIGDAVNLGSRLEGLSKVYGVSIVASQATQALATDYVWQELDRVRVKGKQQAITILTPVALAADITSAQSQELALWHTFLAAYRAQDRTQCGMLLDQLLRLAASKPLYKLYAERIAATRGNPIDPGWDGITNFETK